MTAVRARVSAGRPQGVALVDHGFDKGGVRRLTHHTLDSLVSRWSARLGAEGIAPGTRVGLCAASEIEGALGFLAVLDAGGVLVPLDPALPKARLRDMADRVGCRAILTTDSTARVIDHDTPLNLSRDPGDCPIAAIDVAPDWPAVIYHTSGSTGQPKPVVISHRALASRMLSMVEWFGFGADEVTCAATTLTFDPFLQQLWFPMCSGATLWFPRRTSLLDPDCFWAEASEQGVTHLNLATAQAVALMQRPPARPLPRLRRVVIGGERMPADLPARIVAALGQVAVYNMYGPTETTVDATGHLIDPAATDRDIPIGRPLPGCRVRLLDERMQRVAIGEHGELFIGGAGLALGYDGMDAVTTDAFVPDPFGAPGDRLYRTGDVACWRDDGRIAFVGRCDDQVKIRGQRIELGEVEAALQEFAGVTAAAATRWDDAPGGPSVIAHYCGSADPASLRAHLLQRLPPAAVPSHLLRLDALPLLPSGKVARRALPLPVVTTAPRATTARRDVASLERAIGSVWSELLGQAVVDPAVNLFETGAHSLMVAKAQTGIQAATGLSVSAVDLFHFASVSALARHLAGERDASPQVAAPERPGASGEIAIVGMALRFPGASDRDAFWNDLLAGSDRIRRSDREHLRHAGAPALLLEDPDFVPAHGAIDDTDRFDAVPFGYSQGEAATIDPQQRVLLELAWHALEDAACDPSADGPVGVFASVGFNSYLVDNLRARLGFAGGTDRFAAVVASDKDFAATRIAYKLGFTGPAVAVGSACSGALSATATAVDSLRAGRCRVALAGAASLGMFSAHGHICAEGGIASRSGVCRPFDAEADGVVAGAGAAVLVLKRLEDAVADGDCIHATIEGIGIANDGGRKAGFSAPSIDGQVAALAAALADARVSPSDIGFVEGHGTGTALGDPIEVAALNQVYAGAEPGSILLGSAKGNIGHLDTAAGIAGLIKAALAVGRGIVPPTAHFAAANARIPFGDGPFRVNAAPEAWPGPADRRRRAAVSAFGIGGTNVHVIVAAPPPRTPSPMPDRPVLLTLSAATATARERLALDTARFLDEARARASLIVDDGAGAVPAARTPQLSEVASSLARRRSMRFRRVVVAGSLEAAAAALRQEKPLDGEVQGGTVATALMFPGQGAQYAGMAAALYHAEPAFRGVIDEAGRLLRGGPLADLPSFLLADRADTTATATLTETQWTQPALFVTEFALATALEAYGVRPAALIGHSIGEYVAACLAGVMTFEDALRLVAARGRLMASAPRGAMLAVSMTEADLRPLLERCGADLATVNSARQCVAAGTEAQVSALADLLKGAGPVARRLAVSHAFHSALMEPILDAFAVEVSSVRLSAPAIPIVSNHSGDWLATDDATSAAYWVKHLRGTVRFADGLRCLLEDPARVLVECGPGSTLTRLSRTAGVPEKRAITLQPQETADGHASFLEAVGRLWLAGAPVERLGAAGRSTRRVAVPGYPFERVRLWIEPDGETSLRQHAPGPDVAPAVRAGDRAVSSVEEAVAEVWRDVLGVSSIGPDEDFLSLGGDSLIAVRLAARLRQRFACDLPAHAIFREGTVSALARLLSAGGTGPGTRQEPAMAASREEGWL